MNGHQAGKAEGGLEDPLIPHSRTDESGQDEECQEHELPDGLLQHHNTTWQQVTTALLSLQVRQPPAQ